MSRSMRRVNYKYSNEAQEACSRVKRPRKTVARPGAVGGIATHGRRRGQSSAASSVSALGLGRAKTFERAPQVERFPSPLYTPFRSFHTARVTSCPDQRPGGLANGAVCQELTSHLPGNFRPETLAQLKVRALAFAWRRPLIWEP